MATFIGGFDGIVRLYGTSDDGTALSWTSTQSQTGAGNTITDTNDDGDLDIGLDHVANQLYTFSGYYYTDQNGTQHPIFERAYNIPSIAPHIIVYSTSEVDLAAEFPSSGAITDSTDNLPFGTTGYHDYTHLMRLDGVTDDGTTLSWTTKLPPFYQPHTVVDQNNDGNLDIGIDTVDGTDWVFSGYYYTHSDGSEHPIFYSAANGSYYIPYNRAETELGDDVPSSGSTTNFSNNFEPNGAPLCFAEGSLIATPAGEVAVERLCIGDTVLTAEGRAVLVKWIGRQTVMTRFGPAERLMPVRFAAGSLGAGLPHADLTVTADHGMLVDGVICHAGALVNGTSITRVPLAEMGETYTVYHVETEEHEIILANGAPAETFIDNVSRRVFDNFAEFEALYGDVPEMEELPYPRAMSARQVSASIVGKLSRRAAA
ncbi:Hint domain-containing protein [Nioella sp. MMSF_3534]|uniref:Hint domain-containing protein n=1 Tax=Nioella sp. MMSF_3534 TaxID=3046720 RepID=UPI00273F4754|nr:Hint domain-containing protein [Nioella sp. MMSF_3534]